MYVEHRSSTSAPRRVSGFMARMMVLCEHNLQRFIARRSGFDENRFTASGRSGKRPESDPGELRVLRPEDPATRAGLLRLSEARARLYTVHALAMHRGSVRRAWLVGSAAHPTYDGPGYDYGQEERNTQCSADNTSDSSGDRTDY